MRKNSQIKWFDEKYAFKLKYTKICNFVDTFVKYRTNFNQMTSLSTIKKTKQKQRVNAFNSQT